MSDSEKFSNEKKDKNRDVKQKKKQKIEMKSKIKSTERPLEGERRRLTGTAEEWVK